MPSSIGSHTFFYLPEWNHPTNELTSLEPKSGEQQLTNSRTDEELYLRMERMKELELYPDDALVGVADAAMLLDQHPQLVRRLFHDGLLRGRQVRGKNSTIKFRMGDLRRFIRGET